MIYQTIPAKLNVMSKDAQMSFIFVEEEGFYNFAATQLSIQNQHLLTVHTYDGASHIVKRNHPLPVGAANRGSLFVINVEVIPLAGLPVKSGSVSMNPLSAESNGAIYMYRR